MKLYEKAAQQLEEQIQKGVYRPGDKLPSVRHLSRQLKVSISTVLQAYTRLEDLGIIKARPQSGFYVQLKQRPTPAAPAISRPRVTPTRVNTIDLALEVLHATNRRGLAQFGTAVPGLDFPALNNLHRLFSSITRRWPRRVAAYEFPPGSPELRRQIARRSVDSGLSLSPDDMIITNGCQEALMLAIRVVAKPGDIIAVESPG